MVHDSQTIKHREIPIIRATFLHGVQVLYNKLVAKYLNSDHIASTLDVAALVLVIEAIKRAYLLDIYLSYIDKEFNVSLKYEIASVKRTRVVKPIVEVI